MNSITMNTSVKNIVLLLMVSAIIASCKVDKNKVVAPRNPNENELITTLKFALTDQGNSTSIITATFRDPDGDGGQNPIQFDTLRLSANTTYLGDILLLDETHSPADTISNDVLEEADQHQFFYQITGGANISATYIAGDIDIQGVPLGLKPKVITGAVSKGIFKVILKHQGSDKPKTGTGNINIGDTDIEVDFPVVIQ